MLRISRCTCGLAATLLSAMLAGCAPTTAPKSDTTPRREVNLRLLIVDDPALAAAIGRLRAEWKARSGDNVAVDEMTSENLIAVATLAGPADAVIYPSDLLGTLAERGWLAPLPADFATNRELAWADTFELLQVAETAWGGAPYAVPFGSPVLVCYYRPDLLERLHRRPPRTWKEYHELAELLARRENLGDAAPAADAAWYAAAEPLARGWGGRTLLARAAAYAKHRDHYSTLFHIDTMQPLVDGPAFVRALEELAADARLGPADPSALDPAAARQEFLAGNCALAISWPGHSGTGEPAGKHPPTGFVELPGAANVYNFAAKSWEDRPANEGIHVPLLGAAGRLGSIAAQAREPDQVFQLLAWLSGKDWGGKVGSVSSASPATTLYRRSQMRAPQPWVDPGTDSEATQQYAAAVRDALSRQACLFAPRIPGQQKYLAALDAAVAQVISGEKQAAEALAQAAAQWSTITAELGLDGQRRAYRRSLGLEP